MQAESKEDKREAYLATSRTSHKCRQWALFSSHDPWASPMLWKLQLQRMFHLISILLCHWDLLHLCHGQVVPVLTDSFFLCSFVLISVWWSSFSKLSSCEKTMIFLFLKKEKSKKKKMFSFDAWTPLVWGCDFQSCYQDSSLNPVKILSDNVLLRCDFFWQNLNLISWGEEFDVLFFV